MDFQNLTREDIIKIAETSSEVIGAPILYLWDENQRLKQRVKELEGRLNLNSSNSGKPPSSDGYKKPDPKSLRKKSGKPSGGQPGHKAHQLPLNENPDHVITHTVDVCEKCEKKHHFSRCLHTKLRLLLNFLHPHPTLQLKNKIRCC